jgi:paraquat-inducible protein A
MSETLTTATSRGLASCHLCLKLVNGERQRCPRCGALVHLRKAGSIQRTLALLVTATVLYIPANVLPIMITDQLGNSIESTIIGGVLLLIDMGSIAIAAVIFIASVMVPTGKLLALYYLCWSVRHAPPGTVNQRTVLYRITDFIGKWSMIDVFVVAILVALIHMDNLLVIRPGAAAIAFACVVIVSMVAADSFDPRMMWDQVKEQVESSDE